MNAFNQQQSASKSQVRIGQYVFSESDQLGGGTFGTVYKGLLASEMLLKSPEYYAIKQLDIQTNIGMNLQEVVAKLNKEIEILKDLNHPHISKYIDAVRSDKHAYIVMEYCNGGTIEDLVLREKPDEKRCLQLFTQLLSGIKYLLQEKLIFHRDIKPQNILLDDNDIKICDFGVSRKLNADSSTQYRTFAGTPLFSSPQILHGVAYTTKTDVWSLGMTLYFMLFYRPTEKQQSEKVLCQEFFPWKGTTGVQLLKQIEKNPKVKFLDTPEVSEEVKNLLVKMLAYKEEDRMSFEELFQHRLFKEELNGPNCYKSSPENQKKIRIKKQVQNVQEAINRNNKLCDFIDQINREIDDINSEYTSFISRELILAFKQVLGIKKMQRISDLDHLLNPQCEEEIVALHQIEQTQLDLMHRSLNSKLTNTLQHNNQIEREMLLENINPNYLIQRNTVSGQREIYKNILQKILVHLSKISESLASQKKLNEKQMGYLRLLDDLTVFYALEFDETQLTQRGTSQEIGNILEGQKSRQIASGFSLFSRIIRGCNIIFTKELKE